MFRLAEGRASGSLALFPPAALFETIERTRRSVRLVMREPASGGLVVVVFRNGRPTMVFSPGDGRSVGELLLAAGLVDRAQLDALVAERPQSALSLERLLLARTSLAPDQVQRYLDYQARVRLLDVFAWRQGFFEIVDYQGGGETAFRLEIPELTALVARAESRATALPRLLGQLPAPSHHTLVRRRRGATRPAEPLLRAVHATLDQPLLVPQLAARLLIDDDILLRAVLGLRDDKVVVVQARAQLAAANGVREQLNGRIATLVREALGRLRGLDPGLPSVEMRVVVVSAAPVVATRLVARLGGEHEGSAPGSEGDATTGLASSTVLLGRNTSLSLVALPPDALSRGALEGLLARCDALVLARAGQDERELDRLRWLQSVAVAPSLGWQPVTLGIDLGAALRPWGEYPDAVLGLPDWESRGQAWLVERLLEGVLAAVASHEAERPQGE